MLMGFAYFNFSLAIGVISAKRVAKLIGMLVWGKGGLRKEWFEVRMMDIQEYTLAGVT